MDSLWTSYGPPMDRLWNTHPSAREKASTAQNAEQLGFDLDRHVGVRGKGEREYIVAGKGGSKWQHQLCFD
jgi:hypothetical protein